jgi:pimeloyl-ACP methyl ester carboxylesterase
MTVLNVLSWGDPSAARVCVALHGITANGGAWTQPARRLAELGWYVLAPDMRGHGESTRANGDFSTAALVADVVESVPTAPDMLLGHSFGGYIAQQAVLEGLMTPRALVLEDPVSVQPNAEVPTAMLAWDEANLPRSIEGLLELNPKWSRLDAAWKLLSIEQIDFADARAAFAGNAPWDLRSQARRVASLTRTAWILPQVSRFVPPDDQERLVADVGADAVVIVPDVGHSIHRDATDRFVALVQSLAEAT